MTTNMKISLANSFDSSKINKYYENCKDYVYSQKHDGIFCAITNEGAKTRNGKPIANPHLREILSALPEGLMGEIAAQDFTDNNAFKIATSLVMTKHITLDKTLELLSKCKFYCFNSNRNPEKLYLGRMTETRQLLRDFIWAEVVHLTPINLLKAEEQAKLAKGEGLMLAANSSFVEGRTDNFLKLKKIKDVDAIIVGFENEVYGQNLKNVDASLWGAEKNQVSKVRCYCPEFGFFKAGTGLTLAQKVDCYNNPKKYLGRLCTIEYLGYGSDKKPRQPRIKLLLRGDL